MVVKKTKKPPRASKNRATSANGKVATYRDSIRRHLSKVPGVDGAYTCVDRGIIHVTSIVKDHDSEIYDMLIPAEDRVEKENPRRYFEFHVRARQKRTVEGAIPPGCEIVFKK